MSKSLRKYPLIINLSNPFKLDLLGNRLIKLGHDVKWWDHLQISVNYSDNPNPSITVHVKDEADEAIIMALVSMIDDDRFHVGEWIAPLRNPFNRVEQIVGFYGANTAEVHGRKGIRCHDKYYRKATKEEIIEHFKNKQMKDQEVKLPLSFVKEAYAAACGEWKKRIQQYVPEVQDKKYKVGDRLLVHGSEYIIAGGGDTDYSNPHRIVDRNSRIVLVNLVNGKVSQETTAVVNLGAITIDELLEAGRSIGLTRSHIA